MLRLARRTTLAGIGALFLARERTKRGVDELVKRGEGSQREGAKLVRGVFDRLEAGSRALRRRIDDQMERRTSRVRIARGRDLEKLGSKVDSLAEQVSRLEKTLRGSK